MRRRRITEALADRKSKRLNSSHSQISYPPLFFNDPATTEIYPLSLHDALPISSRLAGILIRRRRQLLRHAPQTHNGSPRRSEEQTSELQSQSNLISPPLF